MMHGLFSVVITIAAFIALGGLYMLLGGILNRGWERKWARLSKAEIDESSAGSEPIEKSHETSPSGGQVEEKRNADVIETAKGDHVPCEKWSGVERRVTGTNTLQSSITFKPWRINFGEIVAAAIVGGAFFSILVFLLLSSLDTFLDLKLKPGQLYLLSLAISILGVALFQVIVITRERRSQKKYQSMKCTHGVEGGQTMLKCSKCHETERLRKLDEFIKQETAKLREQIQTEATTLAREEEKRLAQGLLKRREYLASVHPRDFEDIIVRMYRVLGYEAHGTPYTNDQGRDAIITKDNERFVVECKRYALDKRIGREPLQKLFAAVTEERATGGKFITTAQFTDTAIDYAKKYGIELIDGQQLSLLMSKAFPESSETSNIRVMCLECGDILDVPFPAVSPSITCNNGHTVAIKASFQDISVRSLTGTKCCPKCGKEMRIRTGWRSKFWGCSGYPNCRYTEPFNVNRK